MNAPRIVMLFDGECPLCMREVKTLRRLDRKRGRIGFEDIAAPEFDASKYHTDLGTLMARIHGVLSDGTLIEGVEVFRRAYGAVGLGWLIAPTRWPGLRQLSEWVYRVFARNRLNWTGRGDECASDSCTPPTPSSNAPASPVR